MPKTWCCSLLSKMSMLRRWLFGSFLQNYLHQVCWFWGFPKVFTSASQSLPSNITMSAEEEAATTAFRAFSRALWNRRHHVNLLLNAPDIDPAHHLFQEKLHNLDRYQETCLTHQSFLLRVKTTLSAGANINKTIELAKNINKMNQPTNSLLVL